jgi:hypothetical protein
VSEEEVTTGEIAANILHDGPRIKAVITAYVLDDGSYQWYATGGLVRCLGLLKVASIELENEVLGEPGGEEDD